MHAEIQSTGKDAQHLSEHILSTVIVAEPQKNLQNVHLI